MCEISVLFEQRKVILNFSFSQSVIRRVKLLRWELMAGVLQLQLNYLWVVMLCAMLKKLYMKMLSVHTVHLLKYSKSA